MVGAGDASLESEMELRDREWRHPSGNAAERLPIVSTGAAARQRSPAEQHDDSQRADEPWFHKDWTSATEATAVVVGEKPFPCSYGRAPERTPYRTGGTPKKSRIWVLAISTAIPLVNPTITGRGM
jgi:hypothetical protein